MKKLLIFLLLCSLGFSQYNTPINFELLEQRDGLYYQYNSIKPFSGKVFNIEGRSEGSIRNGKKNGKFVFYHDNGQLKSEGYYSNNLQQRKWTYYYENGQIKNGQIKAIGSYKDGDGSEPGNTGIPRNGRIGLWKLYDKNGQLRLERNYKNGKLDGLWKMYFDNGQLKEEETYKNGERDGPSKSYFENGQLKQEGTYKNGKKDGPFKFYYENGQLESQGYYSNNLQQRKWTYYYENGQIKGIGSYKDGDGSEPGNTGIPRNGRTGKWKFYYDNGQLKQEGTYKNGKLDGLWKLYYDNGQLEQEDTFKDGKQIGIHESFYDNGNKNFLYYFNQDGTRDSTIKLKRWYENGQLWYEGYVITVDDEDVWNGTYKSYYEDGQLKFEGTYNNGELIDSQEY